MGQEEALVQKSTEIEALIKVVSDQQEKIELITDDLVRAFEKIRELEEDMKPLRDTSNDWRR
jgi:uncharacterized coiled-coil protein SlyX